MHPRQELCIRSGAAQKPVVMRGDVIHAYLPHSIVAIPRDLGDTVSVI
jgi:hypothetical protein